MSNHWEAKLSENFGIDASLESLDGEYDLNFFANASSKKVCAESNACWLRT